MRRKPLLKARLSSAPDFVQGQQVSFLASFDLEGPKEVAAPSIKALYPSRAETARFQHGVSLPKDLCGWLAEKLGVNAILQDGLRGEFNYTPSKTAGMRILDREEKAIQEKHSSDDPDFQELLEKGLREVRYIEAEDRNSVRQLKQDLVKIDQAGLTRQITVLFPVHDLVRPRSFYSTIHSKLLDSKLFNVLSVQLLGNQPLVKATQGATRRVSPHLAAITVDSLTPLGKPLPDVITACRGSVTKSQALWRLKQSRQAVKLLIPTADTRKLLPALTKTARVVADHNPLHRAYRPVVAAFETREDATKFCEAVADSKNPIFMAPLAEFFQQKDNVFNVSTASATSAIALYDFFQASWCYPISHTNYRLHSPLSWSELVSKMQQDAQSSGSKHYFSLASDQGKFFTMRDSPQRQAAPISASHSTIKVTDFPTYISKAALLSSLSNAGLKPTEAHFTQDGSALLVKVSFESLRQAKVEQSRSLDTEFGQVSLSLVRTGSKDLGKSMTHTPHKIDTLVSMFAPRPERSERKATCEAANTLPKGNSSEEKAHSPDQAGNAPGDEDSAVSGLPTSPQTDALSVSSRLSTETAATAAKNTAKKSQDSGYHKSSDSEAASDTCSDSRSRLRTLVGEMLDRETKRLLSPILDLLLCADEETLELLIGSKQELEKEVAEAVKMLEREEKLHELVEIELAQDQKHHAPTIALELLKLDDDCYRQLIEDDNYLAEIVQMQVKKLASQSTISSSATFSREKKPGQEASSRHRSPPFSRSTWAEIDEEDRDRHEENKELDEDKESSSEGEEFDNKEREQGSQIEDEDSEDDETSSPNKKRLKQSNLVDKEASGRNRK